MRFPADVLAQLVSDDPGRPRLTWYDDVPGPTQGERIELSARVLGNWVAKAANLLQDDAAAGPGTTVGLDVPPHWRAAYWALATWSVGATVVTGPAAADADVLVTTDPDRAASHGGDSVLVTLPALARSHPDAARATGAVDEARELATHGDAFSPMADPEADDVALAHPGGELAYGAVVAPDAGWGPAPRVALSAGDADGPGDVAQVLREALGAWALGGSVVLVRGPRTGHEDRLGAEGVTLDRR